MIIFYVRNDLYFEFVLFHQETDYTGKSAFKKKNDKKILLGTPSDLVTIEKEKKINHEV